MSHRAELLDGGDGGGVTLLPADWTPPDRLQVGLTVEPLLVGPDGAAALCGLSRSQFDRLERIGRIGPQPVELTQGRKLYRVDDLRRWVAAACPDRKAWQAMQDEAADRLRLADTA